MSEKKKRQKGLRGDGRIMVTYTDGRRPDGKPNKVFFYGQTRAEAEAKKQTYIDEKRGGLTHSDRGTTVNEWVDKWVAMYSIDVDAYAPYITVLRQDMGKRYIRGIREADLVRSLSRYEGRSKSGATKYRMILKQCFHRAYRNHIIPDDPAEDLKLPEVTVGTHRALDRWEIDLIRENWSVYPAGRWAMIMLFCGLRRGEMIALDWSAIDMDARTLTVCAAASFSDGMTIIHDRTKTPAGMRKLPVCEPLYEMLNATPVAERVGPVCRSATGRQLTHDSVKKNWRTYCRLMTQILNGQEPTLHQGRRASTDPAPESYERVFSCQQHDLRHTFATMLFEAGISAKDAQYYLGHSDLRMTTELYTHLTEERKNESRSRVTGYLDEWLKKGDK